jgi:RimJ/RimL family protein N-acetyltransferase
MDPVLLDFPDSFDTARLTIRAPRRGDGAQVADAVCESIAALRPWMPWAKELPTHEESEARIRRAIAAWQTREDLPLHIYLKNSDTFVGGSGLHRFDWDVRRFEIGYWVRTRFAGKGYITEAVDGITQFAFQHLKAKRVEIRCDAENARSAAVAKRCGFLLEGTLRNDDLAVDGSLRDTLIFSKISPTEFHHYDET